MLLISNLLYVWESNLGLVNLDQSDSINWLIPLSVIPLSVIPLSLIPFSGVHWRVLSNKLRYEWIFVFTWRKRFGNLGALRAEGTLRKRANAVNPPETETTSSRKYFFIKSTKIKIQNYTATLCWTNIQKTSWIFE